jgi:amino acid adenylation domain-containing protein
MDRAPDDRVPRLDRLANQPTAPTDHGNVLVAELLKLAGTRLPDYMVPSDIVVIDRLPLTPNGKLDSAALPTPVRDRQRLDMAYAAPTSDTENRLCAIFSAILGIPRVGVQDNFFRLGGHSLLATQLMSRIRDAFHVDMPLRALFEKPTVAGLAPLVDARATVALVPAKDELPIPMPRGGRLPLSFGQQRLWVLDRLAGGDTYVMPAALRLRGRVDDGALGRALRALMARHDILRTFYPEIDGEPTAVVGPLPDAPLRREDLSHLGVAAPAEATRRATAEAARPFDLAHGPLLRACITRLAPDDHLLTLMVHHILSDGWSQAILVRELIALYEAARRGIDAGLPALPIQYADYAAWQHRWLDADRLKTQLDYWRDRLAGMPDLLELPTDRPRPPVQTYRGAVERFALGLETTGRLQSLAAATGTTLFMTLLAGFMALLARYTGRDDIPVGTPVAGRTRAEFEGLIGFFVNTLVLRADLGGNPTTRALLERVRDMVLGAFAHQDLPFDRLIEAVRPTRALSHAPLFQVMVILQNMPSETVRLPELTVLPVAVETSSAKFDLTLSLIETEDGLKGTLEYDTALFEADTARRLLGHFSILLGAMAAAPEQPLSTLSLTSAAERDAEVRGWNDTGAPYDLDRSLHAAIEAWAASHPDRIALRDRGGTLTFGAMDRAANRLAHRLIAAGVRPDSSVGVCADRSRAMVVALLAVLKAGAAYVPLDPDYPPDRLSFIVKDAGVRAIVHDAALSGRVAAAGVPSLVLDNVLDNDRGGDHAPPTVRHHPRALAYIIYTSGSTGQPKGVMVPHEGIVNRLDWMQETYRLTAADRILQKTPYSFDVSVWEFFWPLRQGAELVMADPGGHRDPDYLADEIERSGITLLHFVPSMLRLFLEVPGLEARCRSVRGVMCSGEALAGELAAKAEHRMGAPVHNLYGPTEASVDVSAWTFDALRDHGTTVPIGLPVANTRLLVLDRQLEPVPVGVPGDLYIGGIQLARGYIGRPDLTAERFLPDPFSPQPGGRLYQTGDIARRLPSGAIEYLGRSDHQVKLRGLRIELGEIEATLAALPSVAAAAVVARGAEAERHLVAHLVAQDPATDSATLVETVRASLAERLPSHMVPSHFVMRDVMPLTTSGKIDRNGLTGGTPVCEVRADGTPPRTPTEERLAALWRDLLGHPVGIHDDFFEAGGHSLLAVRLLAAIRRDFGRSFPLAGLFETPTIAGLAARMNAIGTTDEAVVRIGGLKDRAAADGTPLFLFHDISGQILTYRDLARGLDADRPVFALAAPVEEEPPDNLQAIAAGHLLRLRRVRPQGPYALAGHSFGALVAIEAARQLVAAGEAVLFLGVLDATPVHPDGTAPAIPTDEIGLLVHIARTLELTFGGHIALTAETLAACPPAARSALVLERLRASDLPLAVGSVDQMDGMLRLFRANLTALARATTPVAPVPLDVWLSGSTRAQITVDAGGWRPFAPQGLTLHSAAGDHIGMLKPPHADALAIELGALLAARDHGP